MWITHDINRKFVGYTVGLLSTAVLLIALSGATGVHSKALLDVIMGILGTLWLSTVGCLLWNCPNPRPKGRKRTLGGWPTPVLLAVVLLGSVGQSGYGYEPSDGIPVYIESTSDGGFFSSLLAVELTKRRKGGYGKRSHMTVVDSPRNAVYFFRAKVMSRDGGGKWHEGWLTPDMPNATAVVFVRDACGRIVWNKTKRDKEWYSEGKGMVGAAKHIARSFKEALVKKGSRLNRAPQCR